jgi:tetratricopeptide (TPR) repeat protein/transcriptional regulator with XRE-family HTH domain
VAEDSRVTFSGLLRSLRTRARLTQEELASAANLSRRAVSNLERGFATTPQKDTVRLLADALHLIGPERIEFEAAARGRPVHSAAASAGVTRSLPRDVASFTGRQRELEQLAEATADARSVIGIHAIGGMAGVGKTAFAVHAGHRLADTFPDGQIFLLLHGHTPGRQPVDPSDALASLLLTIGVPAAQVPAGLEARMALWRDRVAGKQLLVVLDDAAGSEQVRPLLPGTGGSLVLITSRLHLSALEDASAISLDILPASEAAALLVRLTGRAGLSPDEPAVAQLAQLCGYLPLAIGMLARQLHHHPSWSVAGRAADLAAARDRLDLMATENVSVAAAFDLSYANLTPARQRLFRRLGLHPGADIDAYAAAALDEVDLTAAREGLEALYDHYLLTEPAPGRYRLHDLLREHARAQAVREDSVAERDQAIARLLDYYQDAAARAGALIVRQARPGPASAGSRTSAEVPALSDTEQALAWARAERDSLLACLDHATRTGQHTRVVALTAGTAGLLRRDGPWAEAIMRHTAAAEAARHLGDGLGEASALTDLGEVRCVTGDYSAAAGTLEQALAIYRDLGERLGEANAISCLGLVRYMTGEYPAAAQAEEQALGVYRALGDRRGEANALHHLGVVQWLMSDYPAAVKSLEDALGIYGDLGDQLGQAGTLQQLGGVWFARGDYPAAATSLQQALDICGDLGDRHGQANALNWLGEVQRTTGNYPAAASSQERALDIYRDLGARFGQANALRELAVVRQLTGEYAAADRALVDALEIYRHLGVRIGEAAALHELGIVRRLMGNYPASAEALDEALAIHREIGHREKQAMSLNERGTLYWVTGDLARAEECHQEALELARAIGSPPHEAAALAGLGRCALGAGDEARARTFLGQSLEIFRRVGAPEAQDLEAELARLSRVTEAHSGRKLERSPHRS